MRAQRRRLPAGLAVIAAGGLALTGIALPASAAPADPGTIGVEQSFAGGDYIVTLVDDAVATYDGGVSGFDATAPDEGDQLDAKLAPVEEYSDYLEGQQQEVADSVGADIQVSYTMAVNAFAASLSAEQATALASDRKVAAVTPNEHLKVTAVPSTDFLGLSGEGGVWESVGGAENAGAGIVVGVLDTGIAPENPAFAGDPLGTTPGARPTSTVTPSPTRVRRHRLHRRLRDGRAVHRATTAARRSSVRATSSTASASRTSVTHRPARASSSPRGMATGHGSHTASTAAGNVGTPAEIEGIDFGTYTGVAPGAKIAVYKVCWSGTDPASQDDDACRPAGILAGIDAAVSDGVDVINYSIGGGAAWTTSSVIDDAFLGAAASGIFVSASAGNDGPGASTLDNASPWITAVAATTIPSYEGTVTLGDGQAYAGASITLPMDGTPISGDLVNAVDVAVPDAVDAALCAPGSLDDARHGDHHRGLRARSLRPGCQVGRGRPCGRSRDGDGQRVTRLDRHRLPLGAERAPGRDVPRPGRRVRGHRGRDRDSDRGQLDGLHPADPAGRRLLVARARARRRRPRRRPTSRRPASRSSPRVPTRRGQPYIALPLRYLDGSPAYRGTRRAVPGRDTRTHRRWR